MTATQTTEPAGDVETKRRQTKKRQGFFGIPRVALQALIDQKATAAEIAAYLTLARFTDKTHMFSTAGIKAIRTALRVGEPKAKALVQRLSGYRVSLPNPNDRRRKLGTSSLVAKPDDWKRETRQAIPEAKGERDAVRLVLNTFDGKMVYFANTLVDGLRSKPLANLCTAGDIAARLLLLMYRDNEMETWSGVHPMLLHRKYDLTGFDDDDGTLTKPIKHGNGRALWGAVKGSQTATTAAIDLAMGQKCTDESWPKAFEHAVNALFDLGFVYEVATVFSQEPTGQNNYDAQLLYPLRTLDRRGRQKRGEMGVYKVMTSMARAWGVEAFNTDIDVQSYQDRYPFLVPTYITKPAVVGIYRLRYRPHIEQNGRAFAMLADGERQAIEWIRDVFPHLPALKDYEAELAEPEAV